MEGEMFEQRATADHLRTLARSRHLGRNALERGWRLVGHVPGGRAWSRFLNYTLLILAVVFTVSGIFFFFAYNWADMHRFLKFGLIEAAILVAAGVAFYQGLDKLSGRISLGVAAFLVGALLAVYGQTYQTGADSYQLFLNWALLIAGWVIISAFAPLWFTQLVLLNLSLILYWNQLIRKDLLILFELLFLLNAGALFAWEYARRKFPWLKGKWVVPLVALASFVYVVGPTLGFIFSWGDRLEWHLIVAPILYLGYSFLTWFFYSRRRRNLLVLALCFFGAVTVVSSALGKVLFDMFDSDSAAMYLILGLAIVGQAALAVRWLRKIAETWEGAR